MSCKKSPVAKEDVNRFFISWSHAPQSRWWLYVRVDGKKDPWSCIDLRWWSGPMKDKTICSSRCPSKCPNYYIDPPPTPSTTITFRPHPSLDIVVIGSRPIQPGNLPDGLNCDKFIWEGRAWTKSQQSQCKVDKYRPYFNEDHCAAMDERVVCPCPA